MRCSAGDKGGDKAVNLVDREILAVDLQPDQPRQKIVAGLPAPVGDHHVEIGAKLIARLGVGQVAGPTARTASGR